MCQTSQTSYSNALVHWSGEVARVTVPFFTGDVEGKFQRLQWTPGQSSWPPFRFCVNNDVDLSSPCIYGIQLQWRHNERNGVSNHRRIDCLLKRLFGRRSKLRVTGLCEGNSPVTGEFLSQRASTAENIPVRWFHYESSQWLLMPGLLVKTYHIYYWWSLIKTH